MVSLCHGWTLVCKSGTVPSPSNSWATKPVHEPTSDQSFVPIDRRDAKLAKLLGRSFKMVVEPAPQQLLDQDGDAPAVKRAKKDLKDEIPAYVTLEVQTVDGGSHSVNVLSTAADRGMLWIEFSAESIALLQKEPAHQPEKKWLSTISQEHVSWLASRHSVTTSYWDTKKDKWVQKSFPVPFPDPYDVEA
eukprot:9497445-Pyramimonas_sp.AAC.1